MSNSESMTMTVEAMRAAFGLRRTVWTVDYDHDDISTTDQAEALRRAVEIARSERRPVRVEEVDMGHEPAPLVLASLWIVPTE